MREFSIIISFFTVCCLVGAGTANAQDEVFSISQNLDLKNLSPVIATNRATGDIVVAWTQKDDKTDSRAIYSCYCKYLGAGKFKAGKPRLVSEKKGHNETPSIAFDPSSKSYLLAWSRFERFGATSKANNIIARKISSTGRLKGKAVYITDSTSGHSKQPLILSRSSATGATAASSGYMIIFVHYPIYSTEIERGLNTITVDGKGRITGEPQNVFNPVTTSGKTGKIWFYDAKKDNAGNVILPFVAIYSDDTADTWLAKIDSTGKGSKTLKLAGERLRGPGITVLSSKLYLFTWTEQYEADFYHQLVKANLKKKKKPFTSAGEFAYYQPVGLELDGGGAYIIAADKYNFDIRKFNARGKLVGSRETKTLSIYVLSMSDCALLPDGKCLVVMHRSVGSDYENYEVYGFTLDLE